MHFENLSGHMSALGKPLKKTKKIVSYIPSSHLLHFFLRLSLGKKFHPKKHRMAESGPILIENIFFCHFSAKNPKIALSEENQLGIRFTFVLQSFIIVFFYFKMPRVGLN